MSSQLGETDRYFGEIKIIETWQGHLGETEIRIGVTEVSRVSGSGYVK